MHLLSFFDLKYLYCHQCTQSVSDHVTFILSGQSYFFSLTHFDVNLSLSSILLTLSCIGPFAWNISFLDSIISLSLLCSTPASPCEYANVRALSCRIVCSSDTAIRQYPMEPQIWNHRKSIPHPR